MQEVWEGKGDHKLIYKSDTSNTATDSTGPPHNDLPYRILKRYGCVCAEEKFTVLPNEVRLRIAKVVDGWVAKSPNERASTADFLAGSLTLMAHGTNQIYLSFDRFMDCVFDDAKLLKILRCYTNCVPEPGTYFGEIVAQFFQHCKQQSNLNVKRTTRSSTEGTSTQTAPHTTVSQDEIPCGDEEVSGRCERNVDTISHLLSATLGKLDEAERDGDETNRRPDKHTNDMDRKFEVIMSLKRAVTVVIMFVCAQKRAFASDSNRVLELYLKNKIFGTLVTAGGKNILDTIPHEFGVKQYENKPSSEIIFSLTVHRKHKFDELLDNLFKCVDIHNESIYNGIRHRLGVCTLVYCSDTLYFIEMSQSLFIDNSVTFLYCFLTEKYLPVIETKEDSFVFGLVKILSSIEYFTKCSLKRNHSGKMGHGPLTSVISEGGLNESTKYVNNLFRSSFLPDGPVAEENSTWTPKSPSYAPCTTPSTEFDVFEDGASDYGDNGPNGVRTNGITDARRYVINEPYINTFINRPAECGSMY